MVSNVGTEIVPPPTPEDANLLAALSVPEEQLLQLHLDIAYPVLLPVRHLIEIITVPISHVVPMFQMPAWVVGVYNWRGEVLWVIDLNHFLGLTPWYQRQGYAAKHTVVILKNSDLEDDSSTGQTVALGAVVDQIETMITCQTDELAASPDQALDLAPTLSAFIQGYWQNETQTTHVVLDAAAILKAMPKA